MILAVLRNRRTTPSHGERSSSGASRLTGVRRAPSLLLALLLVAGLSAAAGRAGGVAAPGWQSLLSGVTGAPTGVPGLARPIVPDASRASEGAVSPGSCARRWNSSAPRSTRAWAAHHGTRADITVMPSAVRPVGGGKRTTIRQCAFGIDVGSTRLALVVAPLPASKASWRGEMLRYARTATRTRLLTRFNATVTRTGALQLR